MSTYKIIINGLYFNKKNYALLLLSYYKNNNKKQYIFNLHKRNCLCLTLMYHNKSLMPGRLNSRFLNGRPD